MLDDASFYAFVPSAHFQDGRPLSSKHQRSSTLTTPIQGDSQANGSLLGSNVQAHEVVVEEKSLKSPPKASISRRAQSYTDFHYAAKAVLKQSDQPEGRLTSNLQQIEDDPGFWGWYEDYEDELLEARHDAYISYKKQLENTESYLDTISTDAKSSLDLLSSLASSFNAVGSQTSAFQKQCEELLFEQQRLEELADGIGKNLQYYSYLEPITRRLNAPGAGAFVRGKDFSDMLARLDQCLEYMEAHQSQKEASTYRSRYRLLLTRGLTLIRAQFVAALREISADVQKRITDKQVNDTTLSTLLYAKFRVGATELKDLAREVGKRAILVNANRQTVETEYLSLWTELLSAYASTRGKLIVPLIKRRINDTALAPSSAKDIVTFSRSCIGYVKGICNDEFGLWREWFNGELGLYDFLETVCDPLYDQLRPRIIHETQLVKLCELCTLLQTRYFKDPEDEPTFEPPTNQLNFSILIRPALQDAQTRLVFRAQAILRDDIENFKPKKTDLDPPAKERAALFGSRANGPMMSGRKSSASESLPKDPIIVEEGDSPSGRFGLEGDGAHLGWYPTLRKAVWLLSRIYRLVNSTVFDDLAHQIVHQTTLSLQRAATSIVPMKSRTDSQLFLLKHLLILKQQIVAFDIEFVTPDVTFDFSGVTSTFYELRDRGGLFDPRGLWRLLSKGGGAAALLPRVVENMLDAKAELDGRLRTVINDFCGSCAGRIAGPVSTAATAKKTFEPTAVIPAIQAAARAEVPLLRAKLDEYLDDVRTRETLVGAVQDQVVLDYEAWYEKWSLERRASGAEVRKKGKGREGDVWDPDTFTEWALGVFKVGREYVGGGAGRREKRMDDVGTVSSAGLASADEDEDDGDLSSA